MNTGKLNVLEISVVSSEPVAPVAIAVDSTPAAYSPAPSIAAPAMNWQRARDFAAPSHLSATMPIKAGMNMETMPCIA